MKIEIAGEASGEALESIGVLSWPVREREASGFPWTYDEREVSFLLEGDVVVTLEEGEPVRFGKGILVTSLLGNALPVEDPPGRPEALPVRLIGRIDSAVGRQAAGANPFTRFSSRPE